MNFEAQFKNFSQQKRLSPEWKSVRASARKFALKNGLPDRQQEEWRYTSLNALKEVSFAAVSSSVVNGKKLELENNVLLKVQKLLSQDFYNLVFVDGCFQRDLSDMSQLEKMLTVKAFSDFASAPQDKSETIEKFKALRARVGDVAQDSLEAINSFFATDGVVFEVKANTNIEKPIQVLHFCSGRTQVGYLKNYLIIGKGASLKLIESFEGFGANARYVSSTLEVCLEESSKLEFIRWQNVAREVVAYSRSRFYLSNNASLESFSAQTGGLVGRHNLDVFLLGEGASAVVNGVGLCTGKQVLDHHTLIDHVVGGCTSRQTYKGILSGESRFVFDGKVLIRHGADKASSEQVNKNLLLSSKAEVDSKPQLQIYADDVKATHGSTIGQLNEEEIFYLLSRAIDREKAVELLSIGFVSDVVFEISSEVVRNWLYEKVTEAYRAWKLA